MELISEFYIYTDEFSYNISNELRFSLSKISLIVMGDTMLSVKISNASDAYNINIKTVLCYRYHKRFFNFIN